MTTIKLRRGTAAQWVSAATVLAAGEPGVETDTGVYKVGDGSTAWASLPVSNSGTYAPLSTFKEDFTNFNIKGGSDGWSQITTGTAQFDTAFGVGAHRLLTTGLKNTAVGFHAQEAITTGSDNTSMGYQALVRETTGSDNTALGFQAAAFQVGGQKNTAVGGNALFNATTAIECVAVGQEALYLNDSTTGLVAVGRQALRDATGAGNTAIGYQAGRQPNNTTTNTTTTGTNQTLVGYQAGQSTATQLQGIVCIGYRALAGGVHAVAIGEGASAGSGGSVAIGCDAAGGGATASIQNAIVLGTANHQVQLKNNTTGSGSAALGANSPATTNTAPYTWFKMFSSDGSTVYVPCWK